MGQDLNTLPVAQAKGRIAFVVHEPTLWTHYSSVWARLDPSRFVIVLTNRFRGSGPGVSEFVSKAEAAGYPIVFAEDLLSEGIRCAYAVSNHKLGGEDLGRASIPLLFLWRVGKLAKRALNAILARLGMPPGFTWSGFAPGQFWPLQVADRQIRFMYGADIGDGWSLAEWNRMYDAFLCHGPNDAQQISKRFDGATFQMGYPRYDAYFDGKLDVSAEVEEFAIDPLKPTVLWMPTFGAGACSIPHFANALAAHQSRYNLIVRPHPLSMRESPEEIALLRALGYRIDGNPVRDMNRLYSVVDAVLCDYGGSAFGALYLGKRMLLLAVPGSESWYTVRNSSNLELSDHFPVIHPGDAHRLPELLADESYWAEHAAGIAQLSARFFADLRGNSSARAAELLLSMDELLKPSKGISESTCH